jgi:hypothetical protein
MTCRVLVATFALLLVRPIAAQSDIRLQVLSYQWTTSHQPLHFSWRGQSTTSCSSSSNIQGSLSENGNFNAYGTSNGMCDTTFTPPGNETIDIRKPVVYILAETESSRMMLSCTRNVRWSQCEALSPGIYQARNMNGHFEVASFRNDKALWTRYEIVQQTAVIRAAQTTVAAEDSSALSTPEDVLRVASYRQKCSERDSQGCMNLATMYHMGWGVAKDPSEANSLYKKACDSGSADACKHFDPAISTQPLPDPEPSQTSTQASLIVDSAPSGADITVDGAFVGNTPSTINIASGVHQVVVKKDGFVEWSKSLTVTGGSIHLNAELKPGSGK